MNHGFKSYDTKEKKWMLVFDYPSLFKFNLKVEFDFIGKIKAVALEKSRLNLVFMQFINITNNYGDELCVGDVLMDERPNGDSRFYKIFEREGGFVYNTHQNDFKKHVDKIFFTEACADMQSVDFLKQCKLIGNYIVNPELYTDKKL